MEGIIPKDNERSIFVANKKKYKKANNRKDSIVYQHLQQTPANNFNCFKETVRRRKNSKWDIEFEIKVEELFRAGVYDQIYELLLKENGEVIKWAKEYGQAYKIDWYELFSDFQLHLFNMLDGIADKAYNREISFMINLRKQLECLAKDKLKYLNRDKRKWDRNFIPQERLEQIPDSNQEKGVPIAYSDVELFVSLENLPIETKGLTALNKQILQWLATGEINKKDIPIILNWTNRDDRKKLSRYCQKLKKPLIKHEIIVM